MLIDRIDEGMTTMADADVVDDILAFLMQLIEEQESLLGSRRCRYCSELAGRHRTDCIIPAALRLVERMQQ